MDRWSLEAERPRLKPKWRKVGNRALCLRNCRRGNLSASRDHERFSRYLIIMQSAYVADP